MSSTTVSSALIDHTGRIAAPFVLVLMASSVLLGIAGAQTVYYFRTYPGDARHIKVLVALLFLLDFVHQAAFTKSVHFIYIFAKPVENVELTLYAGWPFMVYFSIQKFIPGVVQVFYGWRLWSIGGARKSRIPIVSIILLLSFLQFCAGLAILGLLIAHPTFSTIHEPAHEFTFSTELCLAILTDGLITATLIYYLHTSRLGFGHVENVIDRVIQITLNSGLLTTTVAAITFITYHTVRRSMVFSALLGFICKIYVNSLLATLNSRSTHLSTHEQDIQVLTTVVIDDHAESYGDFVPHLRDVNLEKKYPDIMHTYR